ncbi:hypothetical protein CCP3SC1AL1_570006 [Gammaproteobacteria bacterium]
MNLANDETLRTEIKSRITSVFKYQRHLIKDAQDRGMAISSSRLSKYLNSSQGGVTEEQILWIATRLGVFVNVGYGKPVLKGGKLSYEITPYSEEEALHRLKLIFK